MTGDGRLVVNHFMANDIKTRWNCDWQALSGIKDAIAEHNAKADAYAEGGIPGFEVIQSAVTIAGTLDALTYAECHNPLLEPPLFTGKYQGGTLVTIRYEPRKKDEIQKWLDEACEGKCSLVTNSTADADIVGDRKPIQSAGVALAANKFEFRGAEAWKGNPVMSVKFDSETDAERFHGKWHI